MALTPSTKETRVTNASRAVEKLKEMIRRAEATIVVLKADLEIAEQKLQAWIDTPTAGDSTASQGRRARIAAQLSGEQE